VETAAHGVAVFVYSSFFPDIVVMVEVGKREIALTERASRIRRPSRND
jgi:hypothetical protein